MVGQVRSTIGVAIRVEEGERIDEDGRNSHGYKDGVDGMPSCIAPMSCESASQRMLGSEDWWFSSARYNLAIDLREVDKGIPSKRIEQVPDHRNDGPQGHEFCYVLVLQACSSFGELSVGTFKSCFAAQSLGMA